MGTFQRTRPTPAIAKTRTVRHHRRIQIRLLPAIGNRILETADTQLGIDVVDRRPHQLVRVKRNRIGVLVIDPLPERLKLLPIKPIIQRILRRLRRIGIVEHRAQHTLIIDRLPLVRLYERIALLTPLHDLT